MNQATSFAVTEFTNPSGEIVYRLSGWDNGRRVRKNFPTRQEAEAERQVREIARLQSQSGVRVAATRLTDAQLQEAEVAFVRLKDQPQPLLFYLDFALANYRPPQRERKLKDAVADYLAVKTQEHERTLLSPRQLRSITDELNVLQRHFPRGVMSEFTPAILTTYLERGKPSLKTYNNRRGLVSTLFKFALKQDWIVTNSVEKTPHHRINHRRGSAATITAETAAALMEHLETYAAGTLVPNFALCLFAGIRPCLRFGEIRRLQPEAINLETGVIRIEPEVSKVRMPRLVTIHANLAAWLRAYPPARFPIVPKNAMNTRPEVFKKFGLTPDILRHTFISMFVAKYRSMGEAALQAGNSESIIRKHYLDLKSSAEAERFFAIMPKHRAPHEGARSIATTAAPIPFPGSATSQQIAS